MRAAAVIVLMMFAIMAVTAQPEPAAELAVAVESLG